MDYNKIIKKIEERKRITEKLKNKIIDLNKEIKNIKGIETVKTCVVEIDVKDSRYISIDFGIINGYFGTFTADREIYSYLDENLDWFFYENDLKTIIRIYKEFFKKLDKLSDLKEFDKDIKSLFLED